MNKLICRKRFKELYNSFSNSFIFLTSNYKIDIKYKICYKKLKESFLLFIHDHPYKSCCLSVQNYRNILNHKKLIHCFSENWIDDLNKNLTIMPIGFESKAIKNGKENYLLNLKKKLLKDKPLKILCNAHLSRYINPKSGSIDDRNLMYKQLKDKEFIDFWKLPKDYKTTYKEHNSYSFELCPEGNGLDTHRFYEAIMLNTIPIVRKNSLSSMYKKYFPVVVVDEWKDITENKLIRWKNENINKFENKDYLYINFWKKIILKR